MSPLHLDRGTRVRRVMGARTGMSGRVDHICWSAPSGGWMVMVWVDGDHGVRAWPIAEVSPVESEPPHADAEPAGHPWQQDDPIEPSQHPWLAKENEPSGPVAEPPIGYLTRAGLLCVSNLLAREAPRLAVLIRRWADTPVSVREEALAVLDRRPSESASSTSTDVEKAEVSTRADAMYPCDKCGKLRTRAQGGTTFTICDACWDEKYGATGGGV